MDRSFISDLVWLTEDKPEILENGGFKQQFNDGFFCNRAISPLGESSSYDNGNYLKKDTKLADDDAILRRTIEGFDKEKNIKVILKREGGTITAVRYDGAEGSEITIREALIFMQNVVFASRGIRVNF